MQLRAAKRPPRRAVPAQRAWLWTTFCTAETTSVASIAVQPHGQFLERTGKDFFSPAPEANPGGLPVWTLEMALATHGTHPQWLRQVDTQPSVACALTPVFGCGGSAQRRRASQHGRIRAAPTQPAKVGGRVAGLHGGRGSHRGRRPRRWVRTGGGNAAGSSR